MEIFRVALFGHRNIEDLREIEQKLTPIITALFRSKDFVEVYTGRNGDFDEIAASVIKGIQKRMDERNNLLILVLPYKVAKLIYYEKYYDEIWIPDRVYRVHPKAAITIKNRCMIEQADLVIVYVKNRKGGAYTAMRYADKSGKRVINLADETCKTTERLL